MCGIQHPAYVQQALRNMICLFHSKKLCLRCLPTNTEACLAYLRSHLQPAKSKLLPDGLPSLISAPKDDAHSARAV